METLGVGRGRAAKFYQPLIAATFGTVTRRCSRAPRSDPTAGMDTLELVNRLRRSDMDQATLDSLEIMTDRLSPGGACLRASCWTTAGPGCTG